MLSGGSNGAEKKNNENIYCHYGYLNSSSHLNSTGKQDAEGKYQAINLTAQLRVFTN